MNTHKITMMDAYLIETLRSNGISNADLLAQLANNTTESWTAIDDTFDSAALLTLYTQDPSAFSAILADGYNVKFMTINGLRNLLRMRFDKVETRDYQLTDSGIIQLTFDMQQLPTLQQMLSKNWAIQETPHQDSSHSTIQISILAATLN
ncbi:hypothetical protein MKY34_21595 [Sporosarcina sp. FSL K6-1522]|uniref:hypothetical protein n=1 Tax=Sporosarcina sp. FSL K6-1522 TaxID=2921554 RepID=UPI00315AF0BE